VCDKHGCPLDRRVNPCELDRMFRVKSQTTENERKYTIKDDEQTTWDEVYLVCPQAAAAGGSRVKTSPCRAASTDISSGTAYAVPINPVNLEGFNIFIPTLEIIK